jgi:SMP-30/Gluconolactonase/LRE-like region
MTLGRVHFFFRLRCSRPSSPQRLPNPPPPSASIRRSTRWWRRTPSSSWCAAISASPRAPWVTQGRSGYLLFSDIPANVVYKMSPNGKDLSVYVERGANSGMHPWRWGFVQNNGKDKSDPAYEEYPMIGSNGLTLDRQGRLIIATWAGRSLVRIERDGARTVLADSYDGKRFGGTNDVVVKRDGAIYFTDTYGGLRLREKDPHKELDFNAVALPTACASTCRATCGRPAPALSGSSRPFNI